MGNKTSHPLSEPEDPELSKLPPSGRSRTRDPTESIEEAEDVEVEVPPPMRPISSIPAPGGEDSKPRVRYEMLQVTEESLDATAARVWI